MPVSLRNVATKLTTVTSDWLKTVRLSSTVTSPFTANTLPPTGQYGPVFQTRCPACQQVSLEVLHLREAWLKGLGLSEGKHRFLLPAMRCQGTSVPSRVAHVTLNPHLIYLKAPGLSSFDNLWRMSKGYAPKVAASDLLKSEQLPPSAVLNQLYANPQTKHTTEGLVLHHFDQSHKGRWVVLPRTVHVKFDAFLHAKQHRLPKTTSVNRAQYDRERRRFWQGIAQTCLELSGQQDLYTLSALIEGASTSVITLADFFELGHQHHLSALQPGLKPQRA